MSEDERRDAKENVVDEADIEACGKSGKKPPKAKRYRVRIDKSHFIFERETVTGRELLQEAGKTPVERFKVHQKLRGGQMQEIGHDQPVDLRTPGIERFVTMELQQTEGGDPRRTFRLPEDDEQYLDSLGLLWETIVDGNVRWLLIHEHPVPEGYTQDQATAAIRIEGGYPPAKLDMVYFHPILQRRDGKAIKKTADQKIDGATYQRWSRHYEWRTGIDSVSTHHLRIKHWLEEEPGK